METAESSTACYRNEVGYADGSGLADVQELTVQFEGDRASGSYDWLPAEKDQRRGRFDGTLAGETIQATYRFEQEGFDDTAQIQITLSDDQAVVSGGPDELGLATTLPRVTC